MQYRWLSCLCVLVFSTALFAQEIMWQASRGSAELHGIDPCGSVVRTIPLISNGFNLRSVHRAPDGTLWVVNFINPTFTTLNQDGTGLVNHTFGFGSPFNIDFDQAGNAWISGGSGVEQWDPSGALLASFPLPFGACLGISVDANDNKWIAHRTAPGSVSRIDGLTGAITNHAVPGPTITQPTRVFADFTVPGGPSRIWVVGDSGSELIEFDSFGTYQNQYTLGPGLGSLTMTPDGHLWVGSYTNGNLYEVDPNTGAVLATYTNSPSINGIATGPFGRLWLSTRVSFSGPAPSEVRRYDPATGTFEVAAVVGINAQSDLSTGFHRAFVVDHLSDGDGDGEASFLEIMNGVSPTDRCSSSNGSVLISGPMALGSTVSLDFIAPPTATSFVAAGPALAATPLSFPGLACPLFLDFASVFLNPADGSPILLSIGGSISIPVTLPTSPASAGVSIFVQNIVVDGGIPRLTNYTCVTPF